MEKVVGDVVWHVFVKCPNCECDIDPVEQDDDSHLTCCLFNNRWEGLGHELMCPECETEFIIDKFEH